MVSNITVTGCFANYNGAGGGMYITNSSPVFDNITLVNNEGGNGGGGMYMSELTNARLQFIRASNNKASVGGGLFINNFTGTMDSIQVVYNTTTGSGGGIYANTIVGTMNKVHASNNTTTGAGGNGGGIYIETGQGTFSNITANYNQCASGGGGIYMSGLTDTRLQFIRASNNKASTGGGLYAGNFTGTMDSIRAVYNTTSGAGGGIYAKTIVGTMNKVDASNNTTTGIAGNGGGVYLETYEGTFSNFTVNYNKSASVGNEYFGGGGMYIRMTPSTGANIKVNRLHIEGNELTGSPGHGGGLYVFGIDVVVSNMTITFDNVVVKNNKVGAAGFGGGIYTINFKRAYNVRADFNNVTVTGNSAEFDGGGVCNWVYYGTYYNLNVSDNTARNGAGMYNTSAFIDLPYLTAEYNTARGAGGGLYNTTAGGTEEGIVITNGRVNYNRAGGAGGGFYNTTANIDLRHMEVRGNYAGAEGGGLLNTTVHYQNMWNTLIAENYSGGRGGGIFNTTAYVGSIERRKYVNTTIAGNHSKGSGGGVFNESGTQWYQNSIVAKNISETTNDHNFYNDVVISPPVAPQVQVSQSLISQVSNAQYVVMNPTGLSPDNSDVNTGADPLFVDPIDATVLASTEPRDLGFAGDYHLQETSYCIDKGHDDFIDAGTYSWMTVDLDQYTRIQGAAVDMGAYEGPGDPAGCPPISIWKPVATAIGNDWNNRNNWMPRKVPGACTAVYIPGDVSTFPFLKDTDNAVCDQIYFMQGGEVGRQDLLTYNKAHVLYDFKYNEYTTTPAAETAIKKAAVHADVSTGDHLGFSGDHAKSTVSRNRWHMLSAPVKKTVSGDFAFGGHPRTFMMRFILQNEGEYTIGQFTEPFGTQNVELKAGDGFAFWMNEFRDAPLYLEYDEGDDDQGFDAAYFGVASREYGIQISNGIIQLPYFHVDTLLMSRRITKHDSGSGISEFYHYDQDADDLKIIDGKDVYQRTTSGSDLTPYKLHDAVINYNVAQITDEREILIGNPFMSTIDFEQFYADNSASIYGTYRVYNGTSYEVFNLGNDDYPGWTATGDVDQYIPPLQGFFVTLKADKTSDYLVFDIENISVIRPAGSKSVLKSAQVSSGDRNTIRIKAINEYAGSEAIVGKRTGAVSQYKADEDVYKLFSSNGGAPEIFTYADNRPTVMNFIGNTDITIPIGIRTKATGNTTLRLTGMDTYEGAAISFVDKELNKTIDITNEDAFEYVFENTTGNVNGRFFIQFVAKEPDAVRSAIPESSVNIYAIADKIMVTSSAGDFIKQIGIYDVEGRLVYNMESINDNAVSIDCSFPKQRVLIVKVISEKGSKSAKILPE